MLTGTGMLLEEAVVTHHDAFAGQYRLILFQAPRIAAAAGPGQFLHIRIPRLGEESLRRPFSIYRVEGDCVGVLYKPVGQGTAVMANAAVGDRFSLIGPLGRGYPIDHTATYPLCVAGGYGVAPLSLLATRMAAKGTVFLGGRAQIDILCVADFEARGWEVRIATEDGSLGHHGLVTEAVDDWIGAHRADGAPTRLRLDDGRLTMPEIYACGPSGLMRAMGERALREGWPGWLSLDRPMGCGIGACLACVQKVRRDDGTITWARACREGPVFEAGELVWE